MERSRCNIVKLNDYSGLLYFGFHFRALAWTKTVPLVCNTLNKIWDILHVSTCYLEFIWSFQDDPGNFPEGSQDSFRPKGCIRKLLTINYNIENLIVTSYSNWGDPSQDRILLHIQLRFCPLRPPILRCGFAFTTSTTFGYSVNVQKYIYIYIYKYGTLTIGMCLRFWCWVVAWQPGAPARGGRFADKARIQRERPPWYKKNVFPIFFLNDELPVNLWLILGLVVTAITRNTRSEVDRASFSEFVIFRLHHSEKGRCANKVFIFSREPNIL